MNNPIEAPTQASVEDLKQKAQEAYKSATEYSGRAMEKGQVYVRENPGGFALGAFALGFLIGYLLPRPQRSFRDRYLQDTLDELKDLVQSTGRRAGEVTQDTYSSTASAVGSALKKLKKSLR